MTYHGNLTVKFSLIEKMRCPEKKKWVEKCKNCPFNKEERG